MKIDRQHILNVAETIRQQLVGLTPMNVLMSWGISSLAATLMANMPALKFKVNGRLHKGEVIVALNEGVDYYEIYLQDSKETRRIAEDVDFTQLGDIIDTAIESGTDPKEYEKFCEENLIRVLSGDC